LAHVYDAARFGLSNGDVAMIGTANDGLLVDRLWPAARYRLARTLILALMGTLLLWASAKIKVPMWPVPMTLQTFVVLALGAAYGWRLAAATVILYLAEGALGLPVFAGTPERGIGLAYMLGPTAGYLAGFVLAAIAVGWLVERGFGRSPAKALLAMLAGQTLMFAPGVAWLALGLNMGWTKAAAAGLAPFLLGDAIKTALAASALVLANRLGGRSGTVTGL
jgi:biotin transport system substrate-specific component